MIPLRLLHAAVAVPMLLATPPAHAASPVWVAETGAANPLDGIDPGGFVTPAFADLDADGDLDFVAGERFGSLSYYENVGSFEQPVFAQRTGSESPVDTATVAEYASPAFADLDADGDLDLIVGEHVGGLRYFENTGSASAPFFAARTGVANPFDLLAAPTNASPAFADLDDDGDLDLVTGGADGGFRHFQNAGTPSIPLFVSSGLDDPLAGFDVGNFSTTAFLDADRDGDFDLVSGHPSGVFLWFENTGSAAVAGFAERSGDENPLTGLAAGLFSTPTFADLDGDTDPDLVAGTGSGAFFFFRAPEPARAIAEIAGMVCLTAISQRRARRRLG